MEIPHSWIIFPYVLLEMLIFGDFLYIFSYICSHMFLARNLIFIIICHIFPAVRNIHFTLGMCQPCLFTLPVLDPVDHPHALPRESAPCRPCNESLRRSHGSGWYHLVNVYLAVENHHFEWVNQLFLRHSTAMFNGKHVQTVKFPEGNP